MASRPIIPVAPSSFTEARDALPRRINDQSQGRFPLTSVTAACWAAVGDAGQFTPMTVGGIVLSPNGQQNVIFAHLFVNDRPVNIESRYTTVVTVGTTGVELRQATCGQPMSLVGARWGESDMWPALTAPTRFGEPGLVELPTPEGETQRMMEGYPIVFTTGVLPRTTADGVISCVTGQPAAVLHTEAAVSHGESAGRILADSGDARQIAGCCILNLTDYTPEVQQAGYIEWAPSAALSYRLRVVGVCEKRVYEVADFPAQLSTASGFEARIF